MAKPRTVLLLAVVFSFAGGAQAQKHEVALLFGGLKTGTRSIIDPTPGSIGVNAGFTVEASYAGRLANAHAAALYFELPLAIAPKSDLNPSTALSPKSYSAWFFTPGLKLKLFPIAGFSPYAVVGAGLGHFNSSDLTAANTPNRGSRGDTSGVIDFGGGVDVRLVPHFALRGEIRDFLSGTPNFNVTVSGSRQHNVFFGAGVVFRF